MENMSIISANEAAEASKQNEKFKDIASKEYFNECIDVFAREINLQINYGNYDTYVNCPIHDIATRESVLQYLHKLGYKADYEENSGVMEISWKSVIEN